MAKKDDWNDFDSFGSGKDFDEFYSDNEKPVSGKQPSRRRGSRKAHGSGFGKIAMIALAAVVVVGAAVAGVRALTGSGRSDSAAGKKGSSAKLPAGVVAQELNFTSPSTDGMVPDLYYWAPGEVAYDRKSGDHTHYYKTEAAVIDAYVRMLQDNGFTLVDTFSQTYKKTFLSWAFTCDAKPDARTVTNQYTDTPCHVTIWYADKKGKYTISVSEDLVVGDTGLRKDGGNASLAPSGPSACAGLERNKDGSYQTTDGRLKAALGTAMVLRDGTAYITDASYAHEDGDEVLRVENFYRNEGIYFQAPESSLLQGDVFTQRELRRERWHDHKTMQDLAGFRWDTPMLAMPRDGVWLGASKNESVYESQTVRVMYYDKGGEAVFYIYAKFLRGEPQEIEALCVVDTTQANSTIQDATYMKPGKEATVKYTHHENGTSYETYEWEIIEGKDKISIDGVGKTCTVTAKSPGVAKVQVTYGYSKEEPNVLTGNMQTVGHSKTEVYTFIIE